MQDEERPYKGKFDTLIVPKKDQNHTDLQKAIMYCDENRAERIDIVCATGARMDHTLSNIRVLRKMYRLERPIFIHTESQTLEYVKDGKTLIKGEIGDYCGILAFPDAQFTSTGLVWDGDNYQLKSGFSDSISNELKDKEANIKIEGEALVVHPGILQSQRKFSLLNVVEQLKKLAEQENYYLLETTYQEINSYKKKF